MINYQWKIEQLNRKTEDGFVTTAHWRCDATDGEYVNGKYQYSAGVYGSAGFTGDLTTPYEDLTEAQVLEWVWESIDKEETESNVLKQIESQKQPVTASGLPW
jgi:hypothetical protein